MLRAPRVTIELFGDHHAERIHRSFTRRHPRFRVTPAKRWGVALVRLPDSFEAYLAGGSKALLRQKRRLATAKGFSHAIVPSAAHLDEILEINLSSASRQGRPMPAAYVDRNALLEWARGRPTIHGILDQSGRLRAYAWVPDAGDLILFERLLAHAADLELGTMYLLVSEVIRYHLDTRRPNGTPHWAMYDTFWGAKPGLAYFKRRLGFEPYTVDWIWGSPAGHEPAPSAASRPDP
ncbi:MAG: GNAT family N-acetyltransferase [Acidimicrobiales bacterium]